jgi:NADPH-dependent 2,4-dienoyl-CoA reductase/sulfur reductase-like enzyme/rhodanese-related sulfurtransferase
MPYFIGGEITDRAAMAVQTPESLHAKLNIDVKVNTRVTSIDKEAKKVVARNELIGEETEYSYDHLILAVGAEPFKPPIPGIDRPGLFSLRNLKDMDQIAHWIDRKLAEHGGTMHAVVAGAGFIGLEMVEELSHRNIHVTLVEMMPQILGPLDPEMAMMLQRESEKHNVDVITGDGIKEFQPAKDGDSESSVLVLNSGKVLAPAQLTILGLGVRPDTKVIMEAGIECTPRGHIVVDDQLRTNTPNVWAVGDAIEVHNPILEGSDEKWCVPLAGPANRQGRMVADNICGKERSFKGTYGASVVRVFNLLAASVGMNEKFLKAKGLPYTSVHVHPGSHAGYYPGAKSIHLKLVFDPNTGKIWGAQAVGEDGVEKRIDVISTAMQGNLTVEDLAEIELCYAPPVGSAKDPVNIAGMAAQNIVDGIVEHIAFSELAEAMNDPDTVVLDVRNPGEIKNNGQLVPNAIEIPLPELRGRLAEVPRDKRVIVSCASGQRAYYASRILKQHGYDRVPYLDGAFKTYQFNPELPN